MAQLEELQKLHTELTGCGIGVDPSLTQTTLTEVNKAWSRMNESAQRMEIQLNAEEDRHKRLDALLQTYREQALAARSWLLAHGTLATVTGKRLSWLRVLHEELEKALGDADHSMGSQMARLRDLSAQLQEQGVSLTGESHLEFSLLQSEWDKLVPQLKRRIEQVANDIAHRDSMRIQYKMAPEQVDELLDIFEYFDTDHNGTLDRGEVAQMMQALGERVRGEEFDRRFAEIDKDGSGTIDLNEFAELMRSRVRSIETPQQLLDFFFGLGTANQVTAERIIHVFGTVLTPAERSHLNSELRIRPNGAVDLNGLVSALCER
ncbi:hypothetical protein PAPYR_7308 [Paratrimastix pyriformis]|uniref:EF-hand domain-containing protein n=1 Tax=Paratrimastix pyriformis TaxID=342808 RepID=A0ABQ8UDB0_9EUKA|nr:hypothetical protein PAPYR_7308 [Paratrimastix pyriformis]